MLYVRWLDELGRGDVELAGGKGANLGEIAGIVPVPPGFVVLSTAFKRHMETNGLYGKIREIIESTIRQGSPEEYEEASRKVRALVEEAPMPREVEEEIVKAYMELGGKLGLSSPAVAVRSSATAEDIPEASFAGQQDTYLNVRGAENVVMYVKKVWSSLFTGRAIMYRDSMGIPHEKSSMAVVVQKMVNSRSSGVMFTLHPVTGHRDVVVVESVWGLGEGIVRGIVTPDRFVVSKSDMKILERGINVKRMAVVRDEGGLTREVELPPEKASAPSLSDDEVVALAKHGIALERHYGHPLDIEFAVDEDAPRPHNIYIVQARPETVWSRRGGAAQGAEVRGSVVVRGVPASPGVASGRARICLTVDEAKAKMQKGDILVTRMTDPDWVPYMKLAAAIVTDEGGMTSHAAIVSRELGVPAVVGTGNATQVMKDGEVYTVDGGRGVVYEGRVEAAERREEAPAAAPREIILHVYRAVPTATKIYMNLGIPDKIDEYKDLPFDGIGLMRIEFIIASYVGEHPLHLVDVGAPEKFVDRLAEGIAHVASAIWPRPVIVRLSDFKSNEYRQLRGGDRYEPEERNPMLGWRGASRYISPRYERAFRLELRAIRKAREDLGLKNVHVMVPFVRAPWEMERINALLEEEGIYRGRDFKLWAMAEVPSIALLVEEFAKYVDGFSIGSNDLTQLVLGADRDNELLVREDPRYFDEREPAVLRAMHNIIKQAHRRGKKVSICGQSPSVYPEIAEFLVRAGIDSISVNPDAVIQTRLFVASIERKIMLERLEEVRNYLYRRTEEEEFREELSRVFGSLTY